jgi:hypothetical protein
MIFIILTLTLTLILIEVVLQGVIRYFRKDFQWLITEKDEHPFFDKEAFKSFIHNSHDKELGWVRKPNTTGVDHGKYGNILYHIDELGSRKNTIIGDVSIATFGDSYVFCRQVEDNQTWQVHLSKKLDSKILNFGVGNYGIDQAFLYYQNKPVPAATKVVILGFVPETICRIQSYWKHYLEFGNIFAFKPMFSLEKGKLTLHKNLMGGMEDFDKIDKVIESIKDKDLLYKSKFKRFQFRFPYLLRYFFNFQRNSTLIYLLIKRKIFSVLKIKNTDVENAPFSKIMLDNIKFSHDMYKDSYACDLLKTILMEFCDEAHRRGHKPLVLVMPQMIDIKIINKCGYTPYNNFFSDLNNKIPVLDVTQHLNNAEVDSFYTEDVYGGHFSELGNRLVSDKVLDYINRNSLLV